MPCCILDKPEGTRVSADDLKGVLHVEKIDLNIEHNTKLHRTDKYECTEDRILDDGREEAAELVLRRGQPFRINVTFSRSFSLKKDDLFIITRTGNIKFNPCPAEPGYTLSLQTVRRSISA